MELSDYQPRSNLVARETIVARPRFPVIDAHNHLGEDFGGGWISRPVSELLDRLDAVDVHVYVDLDGGWGEDILQQHLDRLKGAAPERFLVFGGVDWSAWPQHPADFGEWAAGRLRAQASWGAQGLKIWKNLGLRVQDPQGALARINDPRLDPIWAAAGELGLPVIIHVADPVAFFAPLDATNERWEELHQHPDWHFPSPPFSPFLSILEDLRDTVRRHPATTFIGAHVGCYAENLAWVGAMLDECPNYCVDISARVAELGRQPYTARRFFEHYSDRILFGLDLSPDLAGYRTAFRFLESEDEYFPYAPDPIPPQGRWNIYGLGLPDPVLSRVYSENARRVILKDPDFNLP
jgi:predicted TIM-barrel fold metal-dependent hydrolase